MIRQYTESEQKDPESQLIDLASTEHTDYAPSLKDSLIESRGKHSEDLVKIFDGQKYITDSRKPESTGNKSRIHQPYFEAETQENLFQSHTFEIVGMTHMYYSASEPAANTDSITLHPDTPTERVRPYTAQTLKYKVEPQKNIPRHGVVPRAVSDIDGEPSLDWSFDQIKPVAQAYIHGLTNGNDTSEAVNRRVEGVLVGEPYIKGPHDRTKSYSLLAPTMTVYEP
jgi:hypothetical protein